MIGETFLFGLDAKGYELVVSQPAEVWQGHDKVIRRYVADEMPTIVLTHCISLPPSLFCRHLLTFTFRISHRIQLLLPFWPNCLFGRTWTMKNVCSTVKLPTLHVLIYLEDQSQWSFISSIPKILFSSEAFTQKKSEVADISSSRGDVGTVDANCQCMLHYASSAGV